MYSWEITTEEYIRRAKAVHNQYLQPIITQYFASNKSEIWP